MDYPQVGRQSALRRFADDSGDENDKLRPKSRRGNHDPFTRNNSEEDRGRRSTKALSRWRETRGASKLSCLEPVTMRPASAYRGETASRLSSSSFGAPPPTAATRIGTSNFHGINMMDRPITQQGLSGIRANTAFGRQRQLRDRRYWEEVLNAKIKLLKTEINRLQRVADTAARERSASKHYEARGRELAQELTDLQGRLTDYNIASQMLTATDIIATQKRISELEISNNKMSTELEAVFTERQNKESQVKQLTEQMNKEKNAVDLLIKDMTPSEKSKYMQLRDIVSALQDESAQIKSQIDDLSKMKDDFEKQIAMSQMKSQMVEMLRKLMTIEEKYKTLKEEMSNKLQPAQERDQLLAQVREDNAAIASMESSTQSVKEEIKRAHELLEQAEQDLEEGQSERHQKYRELKKREETMENFMSSFDQNLKEEKLKISQLESDIVFSLEHISSNIEQLDIDELDILKQKNNSYTSIPTYDDNNKTVEVLIKDYEKFEAQLKKSNETREQIATELSNLPEKIRALKQAIETMSDLDSFRSEAAQKRKNLIFEAESLNDKLIPTENAVKEATQKYRELQKRLDGNEMYMQLNTLEEKLADIELNNSALREDIASITIKNDYEPLKKQVNDAMNDLNEKLSKALKSH